MVVMLEAVWGGLEDDVLNGSVCGKEVSKKKLLGGPWKHRCCWLAEVQGSLQVAHVFFGYVNVEHMYSNGLCTSMRESL